MSVFNSETDYVVPARNVLNLRINADKDPLKGESPITAAARSISASNALTGHQAHFFNNMAQPSGGLFTEEKLNAEQLKQLRQAVQEQTTRKNSGGVPVFARGLKWESMSLTSQDAQLIEAYSMTSKGIAKAFRVPLALINEMEQSTFNNAETMINFFLASGLGFILEHIELELARLFALPFAQSVNFNTDILMRTDLKTRVETYGEGSIKGIYSPNEARAQCSGLPPVEGGDEPRVQQQVVPLSAWYSQPEPEPAPEPAANEEMVLESFVSGMNKGMSNAD